MLRNPAGSWTCSDGDDCRPGLPAYITLLRVKGHHELNFLTALHWTSFSRASEPINEAVLCSPHGMQTHTPALQTLLQRLRSPHRTLALLHGLKESWTWGWQTTFGARSGLELFRAGQARYWIGTHDDRLRYEGLVW
ncbi:uncharacterized protein M421DRAFT_3986 [Didymella exigua CBS 183.55]|uniref:Uncharacterized protein n=1 Tax=Didymella exigua CBS 183.55 TaxID=1150837 RepID=A0A6A5RM65_9PLEO|nr:uncharacterized protein M421DRAFT_3986 [Didymella exigua CBS 183.55]KAF1929515.1 hypothetical protein M421DRAFT_3986 [Didymella exigua CBS 183.55]